MAKINYKKISEVLDSSSEAFMLIALFGLFSIPFVIGANLVAVSGDDPNNSTASVVKYYDEPVANSDDGLGEIDLRKSTFATEGFEPIGDEVAEVDSTANENVLGVQTSENSGSEENVADDNKESSKFTVEKNNQNLAQFNNVRISTEEDGYTVKFSSNDSFTKREMFRFKNTMGGTSAFKFDLKTTSNAASLFIDEVEFNASDDLPEYITLDPNEEISVSVQSDFGSFEGEVVFEYVTQ